MKTPFEILQDAVQTYLRKNNPEGLGCACSMNHTCGSCHARRETEPLVLALRYAEMRLAMRYQARVYFILWGVGRVFYDMDPARLLTLEKEMLNEIPAVFRLLCRVHIWTEKDANVASDPETATCGFIKAK